MVQRKCITMEDDKNQLEYSTLNNGNKQPESVSKFPVQAVIGHNKLQERELSEISSQRSVIGPNLNANRETSFINHDSTGSYTSTTAANGSDSISEELEEEDSDDSVTIVKIKPSQQFINITGNITYTSQLINNSHCSTVTHRQNVPGISYSDHKQIKSDSPYIIGTAIVNQTHSYVRGCPQVQPIKSSTQEGVFLLQTLDEEDNNMLPNQGHQIVNINESVNNSGAQHSVGDSGSNVFNLDCSYDNNSGQNIDASSGNKGFNTNLINQNKQSVSKQYKRTDFGDYYPDGGWGWVVCFGAAIVHFVMYGIHFSSGSMYMAVSRQFTEDIGLTDWLCSVSFGLCHITSPFVVAWCRRHSPRLLALAGVIATGLACLFMSFATKSYQVFISYSIIFAIASGIVIHTSTVMVGRFFHCRRDCVEIVCLSVSGIGMVGFTNYVHFFVSHIPWSRGTQLLGCGMIVVCASVATFRSTALYHPRRRAIVHLKRTKKTQKQMHEFENLPAYWDLSPLCMCSFRLLLLCAFTTGMGYYVPFVLLPTECDKDNFDQHSKLVALSFLGISFTLGVSSCGLLVLRSSQKCLVAKQYLCLTTGCMCGITTMLFAMAHEIKAYILFVVVFGLSSGAFMYSFKLYVVELVTRKLAEVGLGYMYACFGMGIVIGTPAFVLLSTKVVYVRASFIAAGLCMLLGSLLLFLLTFTSNHPSNHKVIRAAYLKSKMAEEEVLFDEMNISNSEDSVLSDSDAVSKSPSFHWSECAEGSLTPMSDKITKYLTDEAISEPDSPVQQFCQKSLSNMDTQSGAGDLDHSQTAFFTRDTPPRYDGLQTGVPLVDYSQGGDFPNEPLANTVTKSSIKVHTHTALVPTKSTYV